MAGAIGRYEPLVIHGACNNQASTVANMTTNATDRLAKLIGMKHHVLEQLRDLGQRQSNMINHGDTGSLLKLLAGKQQLISALQDLERELRPYYAEDPDSRCWRSPQDRVACAQRAAECNALLEEIVQLEKTGAEIMTARRNEVAQQLQQVHAAVHIRSAYQAQR